ncbi:MAG: 30S ribosomal protein S16 [Candidatus Cloacimonas sp.]|jgi:small subunit ribosomal protein S16|nr:30S ribosomal protein S16 [Candidatus Cloacimonas sp.]
MVKLRLRRMGANDLPFYRIVAVDARTKRDGKYIECVGWYDPKPNPSKINIETERAIYWLSVGAQPSDTVRSLLRKAGVLQIWHESKLAKPATAVEE